MIVLSSFASVVVHAQVIDNGTFENGLTGWQTELSPTTVPSGTVTVSGGVAELREGGAFLVSLKQSFVMPARAEGLSFDIVGPPTPDRTGDLLLDAFEASLVDAQGASVVPVHRPQATSYVNRQEDGTGSVASGVSLQDGTDGVTVTVDVSQVDPGTEVTFVASLVGGDRDTGGSIAIDNVVLTNGNFDDDVCDVSFTISGTDGSIKKQDYTKVLSYDITGFTGTSGYYDLFKSEVAESGPSQRNESAYFRVVNTVNPKGTPEASVANCGDEYIVEDYDNQGLVPDRVYLGTFWIESGQVNVLEMRHYCAIQAQCPQFLDEQWSCNRSANSIHFYTGTLTCGEAP